MARASDGAERIIGRVLGVTYDSGPGTMADGMQSGFFLLSCCGGPRILQAARRRRGRVSQAPVFGGRVADELIHGWARWLPCSGPDGSAPTFAQFRPARWQGQGGFHFRCSICGRELQPEMLHRQARRTTPWHSVAPPPPTHYPTPGTGLAPPLRGRRACCSSARRADESPRNKTNLVPTVPLGGGLVTLPGVLREPCLAQRLF